MFCHNCGKEMREDAKFCPRCGAGAFDPAQPKTPAPPPPTENMPLGILGACIGGALGTGLLVLCSVLDIFPAFAGAILSAATVVGYDLLGRRRGTAGTVVVTALILALSYAAHTLIWVIRVISPAEISYSLIHAILHFYALLFAGQLDMSLYVQEILVLYCFTTLGAALAFGWSSHRTKKLLQG